jgi:hypothetical protein
MYSGTLINDLFALVERTQSRANPPQTQSPAAGAEKAAQKSHVLVPAIAQSPNSSRSRLV